MMNSKGMNDFSKWHWDNYMSVWGKIIFLNIVREIWLIKDKYENI